MAGLLFLPDPAPGIQDSCNRDLCSPFANDLQHEGRDLGLPNDSRNPRRPLNV